MDLRSALRRPRTWLIAIPVLVVLVAVVAPFVYIQLIRAEPDARLELSEVTTTTTAGSNAGSAASTAGGDDQLDGTWATTADSVAGYRVKEVLFGQDAEATGRTSAVDGALVLTGSTVESASFTVDMTTVSSDESRRDAQFHNRIMQTAQFPTATFELTEPLELGDLPAVGEQVRATAVGRLTLHGVTNDVTFEVVAQRTGDTFEVNGTIPISFDAYEIPDASGGPATVGRDGEVEFLLVFARG